MNLCFVGSWFDAEGKVFYFLFSEYHGRPIYVYKIGTFFFYIICFNDVQILFLLLYHSFIIHFVIVLYIRQAKMEGGNHVCKSNCLDSFDNYIVFLFLVFEIKPINNYSIQSLVLSSTLDQCF